MNILLVNPPQTGIYYKLGFVFPPLGLAYLAAVLKQNGITVEIVDLAVDSSSLDCLETGKYDLVGITGDTSRHRHVLEIAGEAKKHGCITVLGGPHATYNDRTILEQENNIDYIIRREGEYTLLELIKALDGSGSVEGVAGLTARSSSGSVFQTADRPFIENLDELPLPARELLPMAKYRNLELRRRKISPIVTSRGCPFRCPFCCSSEFAGPKWRTHSLERTLTEIELLVNEYDFGAIAFIDDTFTIDMQRVRALARAITAAGLDIRWWCFSRPDLLLDHEDVVKEMAAAGARYVFMGIESGDDAVLNRLKKGVKRSNGVAAIDLLRRHGIETMASFMLCDSEENEASVRKTISFARSLPAGAAQFSIVTPFPGTVLYERLAPHLLHQNWSLYDCTHLVYRHPSISVERAQHLHALAYRRYYLTPGRILKGLLSAIRGKGVRLSKILPVLKHQDL
ncbi:B12-binding domain-containing radical SAM protein [bacterium]|nr:B12-binding domain-containing radical SAM protein [bacterium]